MTDKDRQTMMEEALHFAKIASELQAAEVARLKTELAKKDAEIAELSHRLAAAPPAPSHTYKWGKIYPGSVWDSPGQVIDPPSHGPSVTVFGATLSAEGATRGQG